MTELYDIERLLDGLCETRGVYYAVREVGAYDDYERINRETDAYLIGDERRWLSHLRSAKRRAEFCAGRIAAKSVLGLSPFGLRSQSLEIVRAASGAPQISGYGAIGLSIAHSDRFAVAVAATIRLGVDLERDEARPTAFLRFFLSEQERDVLSRLPPSERQNAVNQFWCRKEAACKVGGWGSTVELGKLDCSKPTATVNGSVIRLASDSRAGFVASLAYEIPLGENKAACRRVERN